MSKHDLWSLFGLVMRGEGGLSEKAYWEQLYREKVAELLAHASTCARTHNPELISAHTLEPMELVQQGFAILYANRYQVEKPRAFVRATIRNLANHRAIREARAGKERRQLKCVLRELARPRRRGSKLPAETIRKVRHAVQRLPKQMRADITPPAQP